MRKATPEQIERLQELNVSPEMSVNWSREAASQTIYNIEHNLPSVLDKCKLQSTDELLDRAREIRRLRPAPIRNSAPKKKFYRKRYQTYAQKIEEQMKPLRMKWQSQSVNDVLEDLK